MEELQQIREKLSGIPNPVTLLEGFFAFAPVGFQIYTVDGHCLLTNKAFRNLFGSEPPPQYNVLQDEIAKERGILDLILRAFKGETVSTPPIWYDPRELRQVEVKQGRRIAMSATFFPLFDAKGAVSHVAIAFKDETAELSAREQIQAAESRSKFLAEASAALAESLDYKTTLAKVAKLAVPTIADWCTVTVLDQDNQLRRIAVVHKDPAKIELTQAYLDNFPPDRHRVGVQVDVLRSGKSILICEVAEADLEAVAQNEQHLRMMKDLGLGSCMMVPIYARSRVLGVFSFMRDKQSPSYTVADLVQAEELAGRVALAVENGLLFEAERSANQALEGAVNARDEFLSVASHELKTPLTSLQLQLQNLTRKLQKDANSVSKEQVLTKLEIVGRQSSRLATLIENLLDISRITANRIDLQLREVDLSIILCEVASRFKEQATAAGCHLHVEAPKSLLGTWDSMRLEQIVTNLLSNACKYGHGEPVRLQLEASDDLAILRVKDHGIGIAPEDHRRVFGRFERATSSRHYSGLGLGLWITQKIVEALGGSISINSSLGEGATFTVVLPRRLDKR